MGAVIALFAVMSLVTGQLAATHAMFCLGATLHCCCLMATTRSAVSKEGVSRHITAVSRPVSLQLPFPVRQMGLSG